MNDGSHDDTQCILDDYAREGIVIRVPDDFEVQDSKRDEKLKANNDHVFDVCTDYLKNNPDKFDASRTWMMNHDVDEFVLIKTSPDATIHDAVTRLSQSTLHRAFSLQVPRLVFGSSEHDHFEPGLVIDRFTHRFNLESCPQFHSGGQPEGGGGDNQRRRLFNPNQPRSYCVGSREVRGHHSQGSYDNCKSISLISSMVAQDCQFLNWKTSQIEPAEFCTNPHFHTLVEVSEPGAESAARGLAGGDERNKNDPRYMGENAVGETLVIMHYMVKSRQEFYKRAMDSVWINKYFECPTCTPETYFNLTGTYSNNFREARMSVFSPRLQQLLGDSSVGAQCKTHPDIGSLDVYQQQIGQKKQQQLTG